MSIWDAIQAYHDLLTDELAAQSQDWLDEQQRRHRLSFGSRLLSTVLRPRFMTLQQYSFLQDRVRLVMRAFEKAYRAAIADSGYRAQFGLADWEEELIRRDRASTHPSPTSRLDAFYLPDSGTLRFMEYNAEVPAAVAYTDVLSEVFLALPAMGQFLRLYRAFPLPARHTLLHTLLDSYRQWSGTRETPRIAIVDWREVPTYNEFVLFEEYFQSRGIPCIIADPREMEYRNGRLLAGGMHVNLLYKRILTNELYYSCGLDHPIVRATLDGSALSVNSFRCKILHKKASFAVLSDERNSELFSPEECQAIEAHIPWTRRVEDRYTYYRGQRVDLLPFLLEHKDQFVLKPNDEYGGKGICLGWHSSVDEWEESLRDALSQPHIVQERLSIPTEPYPSYLDGRLQYTDRMMDTSPFVFDGSYMDGCLTRLSTHALLNVTAGGGSTVPTFLVERR
ncbi:MAG: hypothetical protein M3281_01435 [Chloroflexota bacterium]|nr:hypothetical protein [Chloroflexota bacterium]